MIILEAGPRGPGQEPRIDDLPPRVLTTVRWWADLPPGKCRGNLLNVHPDPRIVGQTDDAKHLLAAAREEADAEYARAEAQSDAVGTTVWGRVGEHVRKLSLLYAVSAKYESPSIDQAAVQWASTFMMHQTRRMLFMAAGHVADNPFHAECLKLKEKLRGAPGRRLSHSVLLKRMKLKAKEFRDLIDTLLQQGEIRADTTPRAGSPVVEYELIEG